MVDAEVCSPPTTSTSGTRCGGLNGCPMTQRSGWRQSLCSRLMISPDELDAMTTAGSSAASRRRSTARFNSSRSGAFSCTNSAPASAASGSAWKVSACCRGAASIGASCARLGQAAATKWRRKVSACGAGSLAATSSPRDRKNAAQLAPIVPAPMTATRRIAGCCGRSAMPAPFCASTAAAALC